MTAVILSLFRGLTFNRASMKTLLLLVVLTAIFDSLMVALGFFDYESSKIIGVYIGKAPIEDFFYSILAVILIPSVWIISKGKDDA